MQEPARGAIADLVIGNNVEKRDDLADVPINASPCVVLRRAVLIGVTTHGVGDDVVVHEPFAYVRAARELEAVNARARAEQRAAAHAREISWHAPRWAKKTARASCCPGRSLHV